MFAGAMPDQRLRRRPPEPIEKRNRKAPELPIGREQAQFAASFGRVILDGSTGSFPNPAASTGQRVGRLSDWNALHLRQVDRLFR